MLGTMFLTVALLSAQAPAPAAAAAPDADALGRAYYLFLQGRVLDAQDDLAGAIASYRDAIKILPASADIHAELADLFARQNQASDARTEAAAALKLDAGNVQAHRVLGWLAVQDVQRLADGATGPAVTDAISHLEKSMGSGPPDAATQFTLGQLYLRNRQAPKAIEILRAFLLDRPDYTPALTLLAQAYDAAGQPQEAAQVRQGLRRSQPLDLVSARADQIAQLEDQGQWQAAATAWAALIRANPSGGAQYRSRYAAALANSGDYAGASAVLEAVTKDAPKDIAAWFLLAEIDQRAGNPTAADQAAAHIAAIDPKDPRGPLALAEVRSARSDYHGVVQALEARVAAASADDIASGAYGQMANRLAGAYARLNDRKRGIDVLETAHKRAPKDADILFALGAAYDQDHRSDQAERAFRDLIAADPKNAEALNYLGYLLAERGKNLEEALTFVKRALAIDTDNPSYLDSLGWAYFKLDKFDDARSPLERAAAALPRSSVIQEHLGDVYFQMKRYGDSADAFERALAGDRDSVDAAAIAKKRDRARSLAGKP